MDEIRSLAHSLEFEIVTVHTDKDVTERELFVGILNRLLDCMTAEDDTLKTCCGAPFDQYVIH